MSLPTDEKLRALQFKIVRMKLDELWYIEGKPKGMYVEGILLDWSDDGEVFYWKDGEVWYAWPLLGIEEICSEQ